MTPNSRLNTLPGGIPSLEHLPIGFRLSPCCPYAQKNRIQAPPRLPVKKSLFRLLLSAQSGEAISMKTLLKARNLSKPFRYHTGRVRPHQVAAVQNVRFTLRDGQTLAIIGENGSGKLPLAKMLAGSVEHSAGEILIDNHPLHFGDYRYHSQRIRMIFQDASNALNPRQRIGQLLDVPQRLNRTLTGSEREEGINSTLRQVGLRPDHAYYYPYMLAPRQKHRGGLARALILQPKVIVSDEALASLDMSMRSQIINLIWSYRRKRDFVYLRDATFGHDETCKRSNYRDAKRRSHGTG